MSNKVLLNNVDHGDLKIVPGYTPGFGERVNQMLVFPTEFEAAQREFPILFKRDADGQFQSVVLLGLDRDENLFLSERGWTTRHVPAVQQRGPFSVVVQQHIGDELKREPMIHVDLDDPRISREQGLPLFLKHGGNSPYLEQVNRTLRTIYEGLEVSSAMFAAFEEVKLIEPVRLEVKLSEEQEYDLPDFFSIVPGSLAALDGKSLDWLNRSGFLQLAIYAAASLGNINHLINLKNNKRDGSDE